MNEHCNHDLQTTGVITSNPSTKAFKKKKKSVVEFLALLTGTARGIPEKFLVLNEFNIAISLGFLIPSFAVYQVNSSFNTILMIDHRCL